MVRCSRASLSFTLHTLAIDDDSGAVGMHLLTIRTSNVKKPLLSVRKISTMYSVRLGSCANLGETPGIGESPPNQPISGLVIFSKYQALSRAVVVNSMPESQRQRLLSLWRKAVRCTGGADKHADVYTICGELSITPLLHRWALSFALQVRRCYLNIAPAQLCDKLVRPCHKHSTRGNNSSLYPFRSSSLSGTVSFTNRSPILWNALQSVSGSEISTFSQSRFKSLSSIFFLFILSSFRFTVGDINSCI